MERRDYLELMTGQIRCRKMCPVIAREVEDHIEDQKQAFMAEGMTEEEAEKAAVEEMGDPVEVGVEMDQIHRPKMPWKAILVIALMEILSGIFAAFFLKQSESYGYVAGIRQIFRIAMAFSVMILVCYMDYSWIGKHARLLAGGYLSVYGSDETFFCSSDQWCGKMDWSRWLQRKSFTDELVVSSIIWSSVVPVPGRRIRCRSESCSLDAADRRDS